MDEGTDKNLDLLNMNRTLQRRLSLNSEQAMYYSFYERLVKAPTFTDFLQVLSSYFDDPSWEHPDTVNAFQRFNIMPEVLSF